jgi:hypothetical protein
MEKGLFDVQYSARASRIVSAFAAYNGKNLPEFFHAQHEAD